jgi:molybdopterin-binding protein
MGSKLSSTARKVTQTPISFQPTPGCEKSVGTLRLERWPRRCRRSCKRQANTRSEEAALRRRSRGATKCPATSSAPPKQPAFEQSALTAGEREPFRQQGALDGGQHRAALADRERDFCAHAGARGLLLAELREEEDVGGPACRSAEPYGGAREGGGVETAPASARSEVLAERNDLAAGDVAELHQRAWPAALGVRRQLDDAARTNAGLDEFAGKARHQPVDRRAVVIDDRGELVGIEDLDILSASFVAKPTIRFAHAATLAQSQDARQRGGEPRFPPDARRMEPRALRSIRTVVRTDERAFASRSKRSGSMKLSARNILSGTVIAITKGATTAHVKIEVDSGAVITASITNDSVDALRLEVGKPAYAIIKASNVMVGVD